MSTPVPTRSATLQDIARRTGVSLMTVSRALRGAPKVSAATRERVLAVAAALGYQPDPHLARIMQRVRAGKAVRFRAVIAVIREDVPQDALLTPSYQYVPIDPIRRRAQAHGYEVEEFWLGRDGLTPRRLQKILHARARRARGGAADHDHPAVDGWTERAGDRRKGAVAAGRGFFPRSQVALGNARWSEVSLRRREWLRAGAMSPSLSPPADTPSMRSAASLQRAFPSATWERAERADTLPRSLTSPLTARHHTAIPA